MKDVRNQVGTLSDDESSVRDRAVQMAPAIRMLLGKPGNHSIVAFEPRDVSGFSPNVLPPDFLRRQESSGLLYLPFNADIDDQYRLLIDRFSAHAASTGSQPRLVALENTGFFSWGLTKKQADDLRSVVQTFTDDIEKNQKRLNDFLSQTAPALDLPQGRVAGKIAIITGGAQGFGRGIGDALLREGAYVVFADLNEKLLHENATHLSEEYGEGRAMAVRVDVTDETAVQRMIDETVVEYGGLDVLISNAGILRAGSLEEMDYRSFDLVNRVNYSGFFLCTRYGSRPMKVQHRFNENQFTDIIQINSKSGLAGSNKNFAYAGSKFGSIGLTQSFALELVPYNIKVNAVCPGNFFDGPLWSDPEKGLFRQYLDTGKVPGAKTIADVKKAYEGKVPMKRGCEIRDVVRAILYIIEQEYETGQAVPVTGGQIMLK